MQGDGTQSTPYRPESWDDFLSVCDISSGTYIKFADSENKLIDFNDIAPEGITASIQITGQIDFNGWTLKNLHASNIARGCIFVKGASNISNIILDSVYLRSCGGIFGLQGAYRQRLKNIIISGELYNTTSIYWIEGTTAYASSSYISETSISIYVRSVNAFYTAILESGGHPILISNSNFHLDIEATGVLLGSFTNSTEQGNNLYTGLINSTGAVNLRYGNSDVFDIESNVNFTATNRTNSAYISVYNSDKAGVVSAVSGMAGCTTEQLANPTYLRSVGFPIGVD